MKVGIVGYARSGKTTIFNALTGAQAAVGAFGSREANLAAVKVHDERVDRLAEIFHPKKKTHPECQFVDVAPNETAGAAKALDDAALVLLRNVDALVHVVRAFQNPDVVHPCGGVDPVRDCRTLEEELLISDLIIIEKRLARIEKEQRKDNEHDVLKRAQTHIESGAPLRTLELTVLDANVLAGFSFLSRKPLMMLGNYGEETLGEDDPAGLTAYAEANGRPHIGLCGALETEIAELPPDEQTAFREELGLGEESRTRFVQTAYATLGLISFLTAGDPEVRAWTLRRGAKAIDAAGVVHSDIQRGFIRAEVVSYADFMAAGSMAKAKEDGRVRLEGKEYVVRDGDMLLFRFNV